MALPAAASVTVLLDQLTPRRMLGLYSFEKTSLRLRAIIALSNFPTRIGHSVNIHEPFVRRKKKHHATHVGFGLYSLHDQTLFRIVENILLFLYSCPLGT